ncbi:DUF1329 domain-containing protein [Marinobacterium maritimum]|uniref:DUF1329 domain-containing protein n=1 Tax=Marinobacterium maritimum TaxID=500162 RepID=A0ABP3TDR7_9GAMM
MTIKKTILALSVTAMTLGAGSALAKVSAEEAAKLRNELTPVGAERAGNADGSIPEWTGGMTAAPKGHKAGGFRVDPFADEKPLFTITASNYQDYSDQLTDGQKMMFTKYPDTFQMNIYQTHRTAAAPQWVYDNTAENALTGELTPDGNGIMKSHGGYPFPIPQNGLEVIWNHHVRWRGEGIHRIYSSVLTYPNGERIVGGGEGWETYRTHQKDNYDPDYNGTVLEFLNIYTAPVRRKGETLLVKDPINQSETPRQAWQYIPGQRRVRRAPTVAFDTPDAGTSGTTTYDDAFMYNGSPERYDFKLAGKKEIYVPYNSNGLLNKLAKTKDGDYSLLTPNHIDPKAERWELHRVWVVEATLKEGKRHVYDKRTFYVDEDTWMVVLADAYDGRGELWRSHMAHLLNAYDVPVQSMRAPTYHDFQTGVYYVSDIDVEPFEVYEGEGEGYFTPAQVRKISRR